MKGIYETYTLSVSVLQLKLASTSKPTLQLVHVVHKIYRSVILKLAHKPGHLGRKATLAQLSQHFYWPGMNRDVKTTYVTVLEKRVLVMQKLKRIYKHLKC